MIASAIMAFLTIVGPALTPLLVHWVEKRLTKRTPEELIDEHVRQHMEGNPVGNINLANRLSTLSKELERKRRYHS